MKIGDIVELKHDIEKEQLNLERYGGIEKLKAGYIDKIEFIYADGDISIHGCGEQFLASHWFKLTKGPIK